MCKYKLLYGYVQFTASSPAIQAMMSAHSKSNLYNYTKIISLEPSASINFYGRVISFKEPRQTRGSDWAMNLIVLDDSFEGRADLATQNPAGLSVMIFKKELHEFPAVKQVGDIVQFRHFKTQYYDSTIQAISTKWAAFTVFRRDAEGGHWLAFPPREVHEEEIEALNNIESVKIGVGVGSSSAFNVDFHGRPTMTVSEVRHGIYFNGTFKVMSVSEKENGEISEEGNKFSLLVCDYTENQFLSADPTTIGLPAYLNQSLLPVTLWDNFADTARRLNLKVGDFVYLDNLLGRQVRHEDGTCNVVAVLHGDPKADHPEKFIRIQPENRKIESQAIRLAQLKKMLESENQILEAVVKVKDEPVMEVKTSKSTDIVKVKKQQTKRTFAIKAQEQDTTPAHHATPSTSTSISTSVGGDSFAVTTILSVRSFPSDNAKFCVKAKIVVFSPQNFYDMVRFLCSKCGGTTELARFNESNGSCSHCGAMAGASPKFIWVFCMIIEDPTGDLAVIVADEEATEFLGIAAFNLTAPENESRLKQVISIFEQLLNSNQSELLFCIKSYRVDSLDGISHLRYRLFNTKLN